MLGAGAGADSSCTTAAVGGAATGAGAITGATFLRAFFFGAAFGLAFIAGFALSFGLLFFGAAFFLADLAASTFFLAAGFFAAAFFAFATGRFFPLLFFAMVSHLLAGRSNPHGESSPEKVCCHLRCALELRADIGVPCESPSDAHRMPDDEHSNPPVRPFYDVWLKPRRVFRALAATPIGRYDYLLAATQGVVSMLVLSRAQSVGRGSPVAAVFGDALIVGPFAGVLGVWVMAEIYSRLGRRVGGTASAAQIFHVIAYGGVPLVASLALWLISALIAGQATFLETPGKDLAPFLALLLQVQFIAHCGLSLWSCLLQVMGLSEMEAVRVRRAFGIWVLGQLIAGAAAFLLLQLINTLGLVAAGAPT